MLAKINKKKFVIIYDEISYFNFVVRYLGNLGIEIEQAFCIENINNPFVEEGKDC